MSETTGTGEIGDRDEHNTEQEDPSTAGRPEIPAGENQQPTGRLEEREQRQHGMQQHGDTFAVDSDGPTDTSGIERDSAPNRVVALPGNEPSDDGASEERRPHVSLQGASG